MNDWPMTAPPFDLPCGGRAYFDSSSGIGYRCETCNTVVGSTGMPGLCKEAFALESVINKLKGIE